MFMKRFYCAMLRVLLLTFLMMLALPACSPAFNWRAAGFETSPLALLLPCKPDKAEKMVPLGGSPTRLSMLGCDAGGATFAVAQADLADASTAAQVLAQWQGLTLANMQAKAESVQQLPIKVPGASPVPPPVRVAAVGQRADGTVVSGQAAYFAQGNQIFQAVIYAPRIDPDVAETFFASFRLP